MESANIRAGTHQSSVHIQLEVFSGRTIDILNHWFMTQSAWKHLADPPLAASGGVIDILVGLDCAYLTAVQKSRIGGPGDPVASRTAQNWVVKGAMGNDMCPKRGRGCMTGSWKYVETALKCNRYLARR